MRDYARRARKRYDRRVAGPPASPDAVASGWLARGCAWFLRSRSWLERNKVYFNTLAPTILAGAAIYLSHQANIYVARQTTALEAQVSPTIACTREIREGQLVYSIDNPGGFASYLRCEPLAAIIVDEAPLDRLSTVFYLAPGAGRQELPPALIVSEVEMDDTTGIGTVGVPGPAKGHLGALRVELPTPQDVRSWVSKVRSGRKDSANCQLSVLVRIELDIHYGDAVGGHHHLYGSDWFGTAYPAGTNPAITASFFQKMVTPRRDAPMPLLEWDRAAEDSIEQLRELLPRRTGIYPLHTKPTAIYLEPGRTGGQTLP